MLEAADSIGTSGYLIANEYNVERARRILTVHAKKARSSALAVTCWDGITLGTKLLGNSSGARGIYDKVLCDVPCSADGTLRKHREAAANFRNSFGFVVNDLHMTQIDLLTTALKLLKPGGRVVYSTCSLNPVENEAVIRSIIERFQGKVCLVDLHGAEEFEGGEAAEHVDKVLPGASLRRVTCMRGLSTWEIPEGLQKRVDQDRQYAKEVEQRDADTIVDEAAVIGTPEKPIRRRPRKIPPSIYPPSSPDNRLKACARICPHLESVMGGFFVAMLEKTEEFTEDERNDGEVDANQPGLAKRLQEKRKWRRDLSAGWGLMCRPYSLSTNCFDPAPAHVSPWAHYGISEDAIGSDNLLLYTGHGKEYPSKVCYCSPELARLVVNVLERDALVHEEVDGDNSNARRNPELGVALPFIQLGLTLFKRMRYDKFMPHLKCRYSLSQDGIELLLRHQTKRRLRFVERADFVAFLRRPLETGIPMPEFLKLCGLEKDPENPGRTRPVSEGSKGEESKVKILGIESCNDEVGHCLVTYECGKAFGLTSLITGQGLLIRAEKHEVDLLLGELTESAE
eukprot:gnl/TRDRNA2_/TRDRNA2_166346_c0_seq1.p1 gnl/TRDRNA2_/TRDRNA2_166346_c0~~gnl/TRDRNA2_/TRDRNA2_166346_c0_seq1.p1  ORF type:complete len:586 (+),score=104.51 gnl/TRDRNA2_/TRDRNA2_166346_c0_seq1:54-1760(+)